MNTDSLSTSIGERAGVRCRGVDSRTNSIFPTAARSATLMPMPEPPDKKLVRFYLPLEPKTPDEPVWSVIRTLSDKIGEQLTTHLRAIADANPLLKGIIDRVDFNATTHGVRDLADDRLSNLIEAISAKRLGLPPEYSAGHHFRFDTAFRTHR